MCELLPKWVGAGRPRVIARALRVTKIRAFICSPNDDHNPHDRLPLDAESERLFALMDADGDGQLTEAEGHTVADAFGCNASTFWKLLLKYDADGDGTISRSEFSEALKGRVLQAFFPRHAEKDFGALSLLPPFKHFWR